MSLVIAALFAIAVLLLLEGLYLVVAGKTDPEAKRLKKQMKELSSVRSADISLLSEGRPLSDVPWLNRLLLNIPLAKRMDTLVVQSGVSYPLGVFLLLTAVVALVGFLLFSFATKSTFLGILGFSLGVIPYVVLLAKKSSRVKKFEGQLPDALDLLARSLKAGHALSGGLQMVAQEFPEPLGPEFGTAVAQITYGVALEPALRNLTERVDCQDLKFLAVSIIIQRESGGNLAEILENIARLIRERFKLKGKIRALSAEGKLSAIILVALPIVVAGVLFLMNPTYIQVLGSDILGKVLVFIAVLMMLFGIAVIKKMIAIKV